MRHRLAASWQRTCSAAALAFATTSADAAPNMLPMFSACPMVPRTRPPSLGTRFAVGDGAAGLDDLSNTDEGGAAEHLRWWSSCQTDAPNEQGRRAITKLHDREQCSGPDGNINWLLSGQFVQSLCLYAPAEECRDRHHKGKADHQAGCIAGTAATTAHAAVCAAVHIRQPI